jgi:hypothetical protein
MPVRGLVDIGRNYARQPEELLDGFQVRRDGVFHKGRAGGGDGDGVHHKVPAKRVLFYRLRYGMDGVFAPEHAGL